jgi:hypothetical protein
MDINSNINDFDYLHFFTQLYLNNADVDCVDEQKVF